MEIVETYCVRNAAYMPRRSSVQSKDVCLIVEAAVAASYRLPLTTFHAPNRCSAPIAFARQIAMYVSHVWLGLSLTEVGRYFGRDRTTVAHACQVVEDKRDNPQIDRILSSIEAVVTLWLESGHHFGDDQ
jgi:chromosomal replication initiation ATPase DnaA